MGLTPTKEAIIGQFINGRNANDDFLQLATNNGGVIFGWIDSAGHLQGSFLQGLPLPVPGGADTNVQINSAGVFYGDSGFTYNKSTQMVQLTGPETLINPTAASSGNNNSSPILSLSGNTWNGAASVVTGFQIQTVAGAGNNVGPSMLFTYVGNGVSGGGFRFNDNILCGSINPSGIAVNNSVFNGAVLVLTSAGNASAGKTTYLGTFTGQAFPLPGMTVTIAGFANGVNNGTFLVFSCNTTTLVVLNASGAAETHPGTSTTVGSASATGTVSFASPGNGSTSIQGTTFAVNTSIYSTPSSLGLVLEQQGDTKDFGFLSPYSNTDTSRGFRIGASYDGTGANPGLLNWGLSAAGGHVLNLLMPDGLTGLIGTGNGFTAGTSTGAVQIAASNGDGSTANSLVITGNAAAVLNCGLTAKTLTVNTATPTGAASTISFGTSTATSASAGSNGDVPAQVVAYLQIDIAGTKFKIPYYAV